MADAAPPAQPVYAEPAPAPAPAPAAASSASAFAPPAEAGDVSSATLFYYEDGSSVTQGPFPVENLRAWFEQGFVLPTTLVAPTYYGEVPPKMWPVGELWQDPVRDAFGGETASVARQFQQQQQEMLKNKKLGAAPPAPHGPQAQKAPQAGPAPKGGRGGGERPKPYDRQSQRDGGGGRGGGKGDGDGGGKGKGKGDGGKGKGDGGKGKGDGGKGGKGGKGGRGPPPHMIRYQMAKEMGLGRVGGAGKETGGPTSSYLGAGGANPWDGRRAGC